MEKYQSNRFKMNCGIRCIFSKRGSLAVETAIFVPLLLIGLLTLGYIIKLVSIEEKVFHSFADESHRVAAKWARIPMYSGDVEARIEDENNGFVKNPKMKTIPLLPAVSINIDGNFKVYSSIIAASLVYEADIPLLPIFKDSVTMSDTIVCRAWTGTNNKGDPMPFSEMEEDTDSDKVWIFPRAGAKYHDEDCGYIKNNYRETLLSPKVKSSYDPCELCKPNNAQNGTLVYCFPTSGEAYHLGSCYVVDRYVTPMSSESAKENNYTACSRCGG